MRHPTTRRGTARRRWVTLGSVLAVLAGTIGAGVTPSVAAPPAPASPATAAGGAGVAGTPVQADQRGEVDVTDAAPAPSDTGRPVDVPFGEPPSQPMPAPPSDLVRPDNTPRPPSDDGGGDNGTAAPKPNAPGVVSSHGGTGDTGWLPPDTDGAVGPNHTVTAVNGGFTVHTRAGALVSSTTLNGFWSSVLPSGANSFDPRILYDRFNSRFIIAALDSGGTADSALLLGVSTSSDPTGSWILRRYDVDTNNDEWADFPTLGFNKNWITVGLNMFQIGGNYTRPQVYAIDKAALYAGGNGAGVFWGSLDPANYAFTLFPATTEDNTTTTQYIAARWNGNSSGNGLMALYTITGTVASPSFSAAYAFPQATGAPWSGSAAATNSAPQLGGNPVNAGDDRLHTVLFRNGKIWLAHQVFLPAGAPTRAAAQWWSINASTGAVLQRGRVDSGASATWFTYPTLAVNAAEDMLIGYSRFSTTQYPSANYSFRYGTDPVNTTQADTVLKAGEANYVKFDSVGRNRWGDYSSTQVDPVNDTNFWTIQEYAKSPSSTWGLWWGQIAPNISAPANDNFANATVLPAAAGTTSGTNTAATKESGEPNHAANNAGGASVWYRFTAPADGSATIDTAGSNFDTLLGVYTGSAVNGLSVVAQNDDVAPGNTTSAVQFNAVAGTAYRIAVDGFSNAQGNITLNWNFPASPSGVSGTVRETGTLAPVAGAWVAIMRTSNLTTAGGAVTNGSGAYSVTVPPGTYYVYVIDPTGDHTSGFFGPPTTITVNAGTMTSVDPVRPPTRGRVSGTVTETGTGTAIAGSLALALTSGGSIERGVAANGSGQYDLTGLSAGSHFVGFIDPSGNHATRFSPNSPNVPNASTVAVTGGGNTTVNGSLPTQTGSGTGSTLSGSVTETGTGTALAGMWVMALNAADFRMTKMATTNASGVYSMNVAAGSYKLAFIDPNALHATEWHNNLPATSLDQATSVPTPAVVNAQLDRTRGSIVGTITADPSGTPLSGVWALAIGPSGPAGGAITAADGTYSIAGLPTGSYRIAFVDPSGGRLTEYYNNSATIEGATPFTVPAGGSITRNAALAAA